MTKPNTYKYPLFLLSHRHMFPEHQGDEIKQTFSFHLKD